MGAPRTINKAYGETQKALKINEELTFSDKETDMFLPKDAEGQKFPRDWVINIPHPF